ncbi:hypothetical protein CPARA_1gp011 (nucleomorph) [Cryptomonas paramecium]|uniref:Uncharacterized protein n=1 Tax=Cryptomonas paramaecium TaxID=2898 RepID=F2HH73_9CRYP|nr:hypothetical protein CPARA_1gp011 [Cryptomonas paramecium]AEA38669.1 hypothetical protein CPARA_1gp011 [Cryptomonas paramecium]
MKITYSYYHFLINVIEQHNFFLLLLLENNCKFYLLNFKYQLWSFFFFETLKTLTKIEKILSYLDIKCSFFQENESKLSKVRKGLVIVKSSFFVILNIIHIIPISATHLKFAKNIEKNCSSTKKCGLHSFKIIDKKKP